MYGIYRYINYINVLIHKILCLIVLQFFSEGSFIRDLCLMRDYYTVFHNYAITKEELAFLINYYDYDYDYEIDLFGHIIKKHNKVHKQ